MKKRKFLSGLLALAILATGCHNEAELLPNLGNNESAIENVKSDIRSLNACYYENLILKQEWPNGCVGSYSRQPTPVDFY